MASPGGVVGLGGLRCSGRLTGQLDILRLMTRGLDRSRRGPSVSARISTIACSCAVAIVRGRTARGGGRRLRGPPGWWGTKERGWGFGVAVQGGVVHQPADRVVRAQVA